MPGFIRVWCGCANRMTIVCRNQIAGLMISKLPDECLISVTIVQFRSHFLTSLPPSIKSHNLLAAHPLSLEKRAQLEIGQLLVILILSLSLQLPTGVL